MPLVTEYAHNLRGKHLVEDSDHRLATSLVAVRDGTSLNVLARAPPKFGDVEKERLFDV